MSSQTEPTSTPMYLSDEFRMYGFKVLQCSKRYRHDWATCPFAHPTENGKRRDPLTHAGIACPAMKSSSKCPRGDACKFAHNAFEYWLHPSRYRTHLCTDGVKCKRKICFFAHSIQELRESTPDSAELQALTHPPGYGHTASHGTHLPSSGHPKEALATMEFAPAYYNTPEAAPPQQRHVPQQPTIVPWTYLPPRAAPAAMAPRLPTAHLPPGLHMLPNVQPRTTTGPSPALHLLPSSARQGPTADEVLASSLMSQLQLSGHVTDELLEDAELLVAMMAQQHQRRTAHHLIQELTAKYHSGQLSAEEALHQLLPTLQGGGAAPGGGARDPAQLPQGPWQQQQQQQQLHLLQRRATDESFSSSSASGSQAALLDSQAAMALLGAMHSSEGRVHSLSSCDSRALSSSFSSDGLARYAPPQQYQQTMGSFSNSCTSSCASVDSGSNAGGGGDEWLRNQVLACMSGPASGAGLAQFRA